MSIFLVLIFEFLKIGLFAAGGGLATLPFLSALADKYPWLTTDMIGQMVALSESTPGPLGINMATYAGYMAGLGTYGKPILGAATALTATASLVAPSFIVILIVSRVLDKYKSSAIVNDAFSTLRPAVAGLIAAAAWSVISTTLFDFGAGNIAGAFLLPEILLFIGMFVLTNVKPLKKLHPLVFIAIAAAAGVAIGYTVGWSAV
jgi:chromate transporter